MSGNKRFLAFTILAIAIGAGLYQFRRAPIAQRQADAAQAQLTPLAGQVEQLTHERDQAASQISALRDDVERLNRSAPELLRLRGEVAQLRHSAQELSNKLSGATQAQANETWMRNQGVTSVPADLSASYLDTSSVYRSLSPQDHVPQPGDAQKTTIHGSPTNGTLLIAWRKHWYPAQILETRNDQHLIRYTGYGSNWDEWVGAERMAIYDAEKQAAQR